MAQPWYTFNRIDNFGTQDPQGPFWKPDSNILLPGNYPITALLPGTVTAVQNVSWGGQTVVTIKLDSPLNALATHTFYEHMSSATVSVGQHVNTGDLIGYNNPSGAVPLGFGLYSGDVYGSGSAWQTLQSDLAPGGAGLLNPVSLLNAAKDGSLFNGTSPLAYTTNGTGAQGCTFDIINPTAWFSCQAGQVWQSMQPTLATWGEYAGTFAIALLFLILGIVLVSKNNPINAIAKPINAVKKRRATLRRAKHGNPHY
jgi:hypothetical protein